MSTRRAHEQPSPWLSPNPQEAQLTGFSAPVDSPPLRPASRRHRPAPRGIRFETSPLIARQPTSADGETQSAPGQRLAHSHLHRAESSRRLEEQHPMLTAMGQVDFEKTQSQHWSRPYHEAPRPPLSRRPQPAAYPLKPTQLPTVRRPDQSPIATT